MWLLSSNNIINIYLNFFFVITYYMSVCKPVENVFFFFVESLVVKIVILIALLFFWAYN